MFMNLSSTTFLGRIIRLPLRLIPKNAVLPVFSGPLRGAKWVVGSSVHGCWLGFYEREKVNLFVSYLKPTSVVYDVGANVGYYSLIAARKCLSGRVFSFEPLPSNVSLLKRHIALNKIHKMTLFESAVSNKDGEGYFDVSPSHSMGRLALQGNLKVRMLSLDSVIKRGQAVEPDIIKMDIEGAEYEALQGAMNLLTGKKPVLFLATHGERVHKRCCSLLRNVGYSLTPVDHLPIEKTSEIIAV